MVKTNRVWTVVTASIIVASEVARKLKFSPATRNGKPLPYWRRLSVEFNLR